MAINAEFSSEFAFKQWFSLLLQCSLVNTVTQEYHDFARIGDGTLDMLAQALEQPRRFADRAVVRPLSPILQAGLIFLKSGRP